MTMQEFVSQWVGNVYETPCRWQYPPRGDNAGLEVVQVVPGQPARRLARVPMGMRRGMTPAEADRAGLRLTPEGYAQVFARARNMLTQMAISADLLYEWEQREGGYDPSLRTIRSRLEHEITEALPLPSPDGVFEYAVDPDEVREWAALPKPEPRGRANAKLKR